MFHHAFNSGGGRTHLRAQDWGKADRALAGRVTAGLDPGQAPPHRGAAGAPPAPWSGTVLGAMGGVYTGWLVIGPFNTHTHTHTHTGV